MLNIYEFPLVRGIYSSSVTQPDVVACIKAIWRWGAVSCHKLIRLGILKTTNEKE